MITRVSLDREFGDRAFPSRSVAIPAVVTARVLAKRQVLENCLSVTIAVPFGMLGCAGSRRASGQGSSAAPSVCGMQLAAARDLAPASAAGQCEQPLVHSMGLIRLIETFCRRLRGLRRAIILEGSQGSFPGRGRRARARWLSAGRGWPGDSAWSHV